MKRQQVSRSANIDMMERKTTLKRWMIVISVPALLLLAVLAMQGSKSLQPVPALAGDNLSQLTTITPSFIAPTPTTNFVTRGTPVVKSTVRPPNYTIEETPLPTITPSGPTLKVSAKSINAFRRALPVSFGTLKLTDAYLATLNTDMFTRDIGVQIESSTKATYIVYILFMETQNSAYGTFEAARETMNGPHAISVGESALFDPSANDIIAVMHYRNIVVYVYANNSIGHGNPNVRAEYLTDAQIRELFGAIVSTTQKQIALQGQGK